MKIYTKTGDGGETGLFAGPRVAKDAPRIEAYGAVDELNAVIGLARAGGGPAALDRLLRRIQNELFDLGAELATPRAAEQGQVRIGGSHIEALETEIDRSQQGLPPLRQFILPGGTQLAARLHVARTVCRRAERRVVTLARVADETVSETAVVYLNRLSDFLFVLARHANHEAGHDDVAWQPSAPDTT